MIDDYQPTERLLDGDFSSETTEDLYEPPDDELLYPSRHYDWVHDKIPCVENLKSRFVIAEKFVFNYGGRRMKILHLPLKKEWYNMIESLIKPEEYRGITAYWIVRLFRDENGRKITRLTANFLASNLEILKWWIESGKLVFNPFDFVKFSYGYTRRTMTFDVKEVVIGKGNPEWGAPEEDVFIIKLKRGLV